MAERIRLVAGDTRPPVAIQITERDGTPLPLNGATVRMRFRAVGSTDVDIHLGRIDNAADGRVSFLWAADSLATPGDYEGEIEITFYDGSVQTVYDVLRFKVRPQF